MKEALAFAVGMMTGVRSTAGPAWLSYAARSGRVDVAETPFRWMAKDRAVHVTTILLAGECGVDKLPMAPARTSAGPLLARLVIGALCGGVVELAAERRWQTGAALGAAGALFGAFAGYGYRMLVKQADLPDLPFALLEDGALLTAGALVMQSGGRQQEALSAAESEGFLEQQAHYGAID